VAIIQGVDRDAAAEPSRLEKFFRRAATFYLGQIALADPRILVRVAWARFRQRLTPAVRSREKTPDYPPAPEPG